MAAADKLTCIKDLRPGMKNVTCVFIVIDRGTYGSISLRVFCATFPSRGPNSVKKNELKDGD